MMIIPFLDDGLLDEIADCSKRKYIENKSSLVYIKCIRLGKKSIADKIEKKYGHLWPKSDLAMAMGMALMAIKKKSNGI